MHEKSPPAFVRLGNNRFTCAIKIIIIKHLQILEKQESFQKKRKVSQMVLDIFLLSGFNFQIIQMESNLVEQNKFPFDLGRAFPTLTSFLSTSDKLSLAGTCHLLWDLVHQSIAWHTFHICDFEIKYWESYRDWVAKYIDVIQPSHLNVSILDQQHQSDGAFFKIFLQQRKYVKKVQLRCETTNLNMAIAFSCPEMFSLTFHSPSVSDILLESMLKSCPEVRQLQINADSLDFRCCNLECFKSPLQSLVLKPYQLQYDVILNFLQNKKLNQISQLQLDMQECQEKLLPEILNNLPYIRKLRLFHLQKFENNLSNSQAFNSQIIELCLGKCYHLKFHQIIPKISSKNLLKLDLTEGVHLKDKELFVLAENAINLKFLNISWCNQITNESVKNVIEKCLRIEGMVINGIKNLTYQDFFEYEKLKYNFKQSIYDKIRLQFKKNYKKSKNSIDELYERLQPETKNILEMKNQDLTTLRNLRYLECISCNNISDILLKVIYFKNRTAKVTNYYGEVLSLYHINELSQDEYD